MKRMIYKHCVKAFCAEKRLGELEIPMLHLNTSISATSTSSHGFSSCGLCDFFINNITGL